MREGVAMHKRGERQQTPHYGGLVSTRRTYEDGTGYGIRVTGYGLRDTGYGLRDTGDHWCQ